MRILLVHERYQQRGGEDEVFDTERRLLLDRGHEVREYVVSNDKINGMHPVVLAATSVWSHAATRSLSRVIKAFSPDVAHFHNTFPLLSPAVYRCASKQGVPVVKTHHNYRLLCVNALLFREGKVCEKCVGSRLPWRGAIHACYRGSRAASAVAAATVGLHRGLGTWRDSVDVHVALTEFARGKLVASGVPKERIIVKPNFVEPDPGPGGGTGDYALFVGRLSSEKGVATLIDAWKRAGIGLPLRIVGDGPLRGMVRDAAASVSKIEWLGLQGRAQVDELIGEAKCLVIPSVCFEGLSRVLVEAYAKGTPVVASSLGAFEQVVIPGQTGLLFRVADGESLARAVMEELALEDGFSRMRESAREEFEARYAADANYDALIRIYRQATLNHAASRSAIPGPGGDVRRVSTG